MRPIPKELKAQILNDPFFERCVITDSLNVSWEHCWVYAGRQINEIWAIVPLKRDLNTSHVPIEIKNTCKLISLIRAKSLGLWEEIKIKYPKKDWDFEFKKLNE